MYKQRIPEAINTGNLPLNQSPLKVHQANFTLREWRGLMALYEHPKWREELDRAIGASNSPHIVMCLRRKGIDIWCERVKRLDRDGSACRPGRYHLRSKLEVCQ
ncbi:MAG: hypothetical protein ACSHXK_05770 [Oceanococcus sp.]